MPPLSARGPSRHTGGLTHRVKVGCTVSGVAEGYRGQRQAVKLPQTGSEGSVAQGGNPEVNSSAAEAY